ncbi:uncharacterized protein LOC120138655 [Hibiscus syriacus]|uniref:uncharacterized protein LOC120138655 n=1 Tax=Hibiscus syriacus TaxID=106335 RepID=UPI001921BC55|nr:uncharacterized protein LOC120138655 [Hibiscus syriacus]
MTCFLVSMGYRGSLRIRVGLGIRKPLKRKKKLALPNDTFTYATFQYEKLRLYCFLCGKLGHGENYCPMRILREKGDLIPQWYSTLKALVRRRGQQTSRWLREDKLDDSTARVSTRKEVGSTLGGAVTRTNERMG